MEVTEGYVNKYELVSIDFYSAERLNKEHASKNLYDAELILYNRDIDHVVYGYVTIDRSLIYYARTYTSIQFHITDLAKKKFRELISNIISRVVKEAAKCI